MGIVTSQSFKNTVSTYLGFGIGALNTLFLYTYFISDVYYGLVAFILSTANIVMPLMAFGAHNTIIKFYSSFKTKNSLNSFLTLMLFLPLAMIIPVSLIGVFTYEAIGELLSQKNEIVKGYVWYIFVSAVAMAYFEVFFAWSKTQLQTVFGNFMKEVFHRVGVMLLLFAVYFKWLDVEQFVVGVVWVYIIRMIIMKFYAFTIKFPVLKFYRIEGLSAILKYSSLIIIAGSIATIILDIDSFMLGMYIPIQEVAYYGVAIYIATVIVVPSRSMQQILQPLTAQYLNDKNKVALNDLYVRSSQTLFIIGGFIFIIIIININTLYLLIPKEFSNGLLVVFLVGIAKLYDCLMGCNNVVLFNSDYYRMVLLFGVVLTILTIFLNILFIPLYGINGSAFATFLAISIYNTIKIYFVKVKFNMMPFNKDTAKVLGLIVLSVLLFYFWEFPFHPIINIALKSLLATFVYVLIVLKLNVSEDISGVIRKYLKLK
ncbi:O-antigen/teichoic acid export membrane protein [Mariniflexile fucanivorans]|uniref:O-antigen/teichoic acid export membrane protein n=1 Tax=Mariniflexile fucanivorans TaxID=264023 RepID=A0A4R1RFY4_9FLAO|nr:oligosaccharide flippase family protein [Mariniflexile fucanivorans]TCL64836.1 O-antigen/teichoic acid export membrane protein [Mariniflexile fucanivorans]